MFSELISIIRNRKEDFFLLKERNLLYLLHELLKEQIGPKSEQTNFTRYVSAYYFSGLYGWIEEWMELGMVESSEQMYAFLRDRTIE